MSPIQHHHTTQHPILHQPIGTGSTNRRYGNDDVRIIEISWTTIFDHFILLVPPIQHHYTTQHPILHQPVGLHALSLWQQWRHNCRIILDNHILPFYPVSAIDSTPPHNSASNCPPTYRVVMEAQTSLWQQWCRRIIEKTMDNHIDHFILFVPPIHLSSYQNDSFEYEKQTSVRHKGRVFHFDWFHVRTVMNNGLKLHLT